MVGLLHDALDLFLHYLAAVLLADEALRHHVVGVLQQHPHHGGVAPLWPPSPWLRCPARCAEGWPLGEQQVHHLHMAPGTGEGERGVVVVRRGSIDISAPVDKVLHGRKVARPSRLHEGRSAPLAFLLYVRPLIEQQRHDLCVPVLTGVGEESLVEDWASLV